MLYACVETPKGLCTHEATHTYTCAYVTIYIYVCVYKPKLDTNMHLEIKFVKSFGLCARRLCIKKSMCG